MIKRYAVISQCDNNSPRGISNGAPFLEMWAAICDLQEQIDNIPEGPPGPSGLPCDSCVDTTSILDNTVSGKDLARTNELIFAECGIHIVTVGTGSSFDLICILPEGVVKAGDSQFEIVATLNSNPNGGLELTHARVHPTQDRIVLVEVKNTGSPLADVDIKGSAIVFDATFTSTP